MHSIPSISKILSQKVLPLCSLYQAPSYESNPTFLAPFPTELAYLSMLFILEMVCTSNVRLDSYDGAWYTMATQWLHFCNSFSDIDGMKWIFRRQDNIWRTSSHSCAIAKSCLFACRLAGNWFKMAHILRKPSTDVYPPSHLSLTEFALRNIDQYGDGICLVGILTITHEHMST